MEILKKPGGIAEKWLKVRPVSSYVKNYKLVWDKIKDLDTQSEDYQGVTWTAYATCRRNLHNTKKLETNSKRKINEIYSEYIDDDDDDRNNSEESASFVRRSSRGNIAYSACFVCEKDKLHYS